MRLLAIVRRDPALRPAGILFGASASSVNVRRSLVAVTAMLRLDR